MTLTGAESEEVFTLLGGLAVALGTAALAAHVLVPGVRPHLDVLCRDARLGRFWGRLFVVSLLLAMPLGAAAAWFMPGDILRPEAEGVRRGALMLRAAAVLALGFLWALLLVALHFEARLPRVARRDGGEAPGRSRSERGAVGR